MALHGELKLPVLRDARPAAPAAAPPAPEDLRDEAPDDPAGDNPQLAAGYTYFGQFVDHDLTFDLATLHDLHRRGAVPRSPRTPRFDLDSVYASGPDVTPYLYAREEPWRLLLGAAPDGGVDLPRNAEGVALLGDPRNDDNVIISQLHLAFLMLHNRVASELAEEDDALLDQPRELFAQAQRRVRRQYQWVVVHDYLARIAGREVIERHLAAPASEPALAGGDAVIPPEFAGAAFRFGHSQIRSRYRLNATVERPILGAEGDDHLSDRRGLPLDWRIDWARFFPIEGSVPQPSRRINGRLAPELFALPRGEPSLATRDLLRGEALWLRSGEDWARRLGVEPIDTGRAPTPLWLYVLLEADATAGGERLGPTGAALIATVVLDVLRRDAESWLVAEPGFAPELRTAGDLVAWALG